MRARDEQNFGVPAFAVRCGARRVAQILKGPEYSTYWLMRPRPSHFGGTVIFFY